MSFHACHLRGLSSACCLLVCSRVTGSVHHAFVGRAFVLGISVQEKHLHFASTQEFLVQALFASVACISASKRSWMAYSLLSMKQLAGFLAHMSGMGAPHE